MGAEPRLRRSSRVLLFDRATGDTLLIRFEAEVEGRPFVFWATPGGEIEVGEEERVAAARELAEELGIAPELVGPVHTESGGTYIHLGETVRNEDVFFAAMCDREEPRLAGVTADEIALMREARWWGRAELEVTEERIFPEALGQVTAEAWIRLCAVNTQGL